MDLISRDELKEEIDRGDALGEWAFRAKYIPGSINISSPDQCRRMLSLEDEIVVYCSGEACVSSVMAYRILVGDGFKNVRRYAGGLPDWEDARYQLEGEIVDNI